MIVLFSHKIQMTSANELLRNTNSSCVNNVNAVTATATTTAATMVAIIDTFFPF